MLILHVCYQYLLDQCRCAMRTPVMTEMQKGVSAHRNASKKLV